MIPDYTAIFNNDRSMVWLDAARAAHAMKKETRFRVSASHAVGGSSEVAAPARLTVPLSRRGSDNQIMKGDRKWYK